jgi:hypothetical protein
MLGRHCSRYIRATATVLGTGISRRRGPCSVMSPLHELHGSDLSTSADDSPYVFRASKLPLVETPGLHYKEQKMLEGVSLRYQVRAPGECQFHVVHSFMHSARPVRSRAKPLIMVTSFAPSQMRVTSRCWYAAGPNKGPWCLTGHSVFVVGGELTYEFADHTVVLSKGDMAHIPAG